MAALRFSLLLIFVLVYHSVFSQASYNDSLHMFINGYIEHHEVVKGADKKYFQFYPVDESYRVVADFEKVNDNKWFSMETSGREKKIYRMYGTVMFTIHDTLVKANIYQSQNLLSDPKYKDYLGLMFTDETTGIETYYAGRYIDFTIGDIKNNKLVIDFNKAYNPYCAYVKGKYNCPIPPRENFLRVAIRAGEKSFGNKSGN
jgi:uncharacterized protein (DUF1684 family)